MADFTFALKTLAFTAALVLLMQVRVGDATIERHTHAWIQASPVVDVLRGVSEGALKASVHGYRWATSFVDARVNQSFKAENRPGSRTIGGSFERSDAAKRAGGAEPDDSQPDLD